MDAKRLWKALLNMDTKRRSLRYAAALALETRRMPALADSMKAFADDHFGAARADGGAAAG